jgi:putative hydrolase of the HAD superfamily
VNDVAGLKAIFFDIDDTLYSTSEFAEMARENSIDAMLRAGVNLPKEALLKELDEVIAEFSSNYPAHFDKLLLRIPPESYKGINPAIVVASAVVAYHDTKFRQLRPYEDAVEALKLIHAKTDLILGVITTGLTVKQAEKLVRLNLLEYIRSDAIFISDQIGVSKPNVKLFLRALIDLHLKPNEAIYIGDNPVNDIDPANTIGMVTVRNRRTGKYTGLEGKTRPNYEIHNFYDLLDILAKDFGIKVR